MKKKDKEPILEILDKKTLSKSEVLYLLIYMEYASQIVEENSVLDSVSLQDGMTRFLNKVLFMSIISRIKSTLSV